MLNVKLVLIAKFLVMVDLSLPLLHTYSEKCSHSRKIAEAFYLITLSTMQILL
jgi:hypothetical protein